MAKKHIVVINDTEEILELFRSIIEDEAGHEMIAFTFKPEMMEDIKQAKPDLIICDYMFGKEALGWQLVQKLRMDRGTERVPVIICSGAVRELQDLEGVLAEKSIGILIKPFDVDELLQMMSRKLDPATNMEAKRTEQKR
ncbi:MAG: response regulator [Chloroflexota bacterium]